MRMVRALVISFTTFLLVGCMQITRSTYRSSEPVTFELSGQIKVVAGGAVNINVPMLVNHVDFFPSSFKLLINDKVVYIDPVAVDKASPADAILITHIHGDHFSLSDIRNLLTRETSLIAPPAVAKRLQKAFPDQETRMLKPGDTTALEGITFKAIPAYNLKSGFLTAHPRSAMNNGYIISSGDVRIYHAGDTDYVPEMQQLQDITLAMVPIDGGDLTMHTDAAAEFINRLRPAYVVPMHYNLGSDQVDIFRKLIKPDTRVMVMNGKK